MEVPTLHGERVTLRPLTEADVEQLAVVIASPGVREWWSASELNADRLRDGLRNDGAAFAVDAEGELAGWLGIDEETDPDYRHAGLDISLAPPHQGRGLGRDALRTAIRWLMRERGHHRLPSIPRSKTSAPSAPTAQSDFAGSACCADTSAGPTVRGTTTCSWS